MATNGEDARGRLLSWADALETHALPAWADFPALPLYMDQVILLMNGYLRQTDARDGEKAVTPAMINNYVKLKIIPPPVKKRYGRGHLAYLVMVCLLKRTISTAEIKKLLPLTMTEEETRRLYEAFLEIFAEVRTGFLKEARAAVESAAEDRASLVIRYASSASLSIQLAEEALAALPPEPS